MNAHIKLLNDNSVYINDLEKIIHKKDGKVLEDSFPEFVFYANYFYNFIGVDNSLSVWGKDIHHVEFSKTKY
ncbi:hypothetical protein [Peptoniphilus indolicus]|uniref:Uncharacterized protein n=1 Tax=Peptoniphilus indolicus TaxID=33030 RepID=A0A379D9D1_9FIRM|nr:hypothetical protein [Peptoniphilus indolicus]SUB74420.1 Uncharacterised protein [Peptoniphilus indolicus]